MSASITEHDREQVREFGTDLQHVEQLKQLGHRCSCAVLQVFEKYPCSCPQGLPVVLKQKPEETT
jgi:hypothetical protein